MATSTAFDASSTVTATECEKGMVKVRLNFHTFRVVVVVRFGDGQG